MPEKAGPDPSTDQHLRRFREYVAGGLALAVILGTMVMIAVAFTFVGNSETFTRVKDLLLFINPILGLVIGYYFSKVSIESRAESAESSAREASLNARQATEAWSLAETEKNAAGNRARQATASLVEVSQAANQLLNQSPRPSLGTLGGNGGTGTSDDARAALESALQRARTVIG